MNKKGTIILLVLIVLLAAFMRLYRISDFMTFLGDEGRDVLVAKGILEGQFTLLGPRSSAGDFFMGPVYYYMMTPFLWLFRFDPVGPAVMVALLGVATVFLIYIAGKKFFNEKAGLIAAALYAVSPVVVTYSHSSWNPNVLPFFSLLLLLTLYKGITTKITPWRYILLTGFLLGIALQLHYLALFLIAIVTLYTFFAEWLLTKKIVLRKLVLHYALLFVGFLIGLSPFLAFEVRHGFPNTKTIFAFIFGDTLTQKGYETGSTFFPTIMNVFFRIFARLGFDYPTPEHLHNFTQVSLQMWGLIAMVFGVASIIALFFIKNKLATLLFSLWLFVSLLLFGLYKKEIYDYHFELLFPLPFLLAGNLISQISQRAPKKKPHILWAGFALVLFAGIFLFNLFQMPFTSEPNRQKDQTKKIVDFAISKTDNKPFNFALITGGNSDHAYRYYFEILGHKPVQIDNLLNDPQRKTVTDQLLVVCEDIHCKPLGNPTFDVAAFGRASISGEWNVSVVKVYKMVPYTEKKNK